MFSKKQVKSLKDLQSTIDVLNVKQEEQIKGGWTVTSIQP